MKLKTTAGLILLVLAIFAGGSAYYLLRQTNPGDLVGSRSKKEKIARASFVFGQAQSRPFYSRFWSALKTGDDINQNDIVQSKSDSDLILDFSDGDQVQMDSLGLIRLWQDQKNGISIDLLMGHLHIKVKGVRQRTFTIHSKGAKVRIEKGEATFSFLEGDAGLEVYVQAGLVQILHKGAVLTLDKDKVGRVFPKGVEASNVPLKIKAPRDFQDLVQNKKQEEGVLFEWEPPLQNGALFLEIGTRREDLVRTYPSVKSTDGMILMKLPIGKYYWRLTDGEKVRTETHFFRLKEEVPVQLIGPQNGETVVGDLISGQVRLRWANPAQLEKLQVEVSRDPLFRKNDYSEQIQDTGSAEVPIEEDGRYFWRISGFKTGTSQEILSETRQFILKSNWSLVPPKISEPENGARISLKEAKINGIYLVWSSIPGIKSYEVKIVNQRGGLVLQDQLEEKTQLKVNIKAPGIFRVFITAVDSKGSRSRPAELSFSVY